jgi:hypothetical protein
MAEAFLFFYFTIFKDDGWISSIKWRETLQVIHREAGKLKKTLKLKLDNLHKSLNNLPEEDM